MMNLILTIVLLLIGVILLIVELFLLPGFGIAGVCAISSMIAGVVVAYWKLTPMWAYAGHATLAAVVVLSFVAVLIFLKSRTLDKMALNTTIDSKVSLAEPGKKMEELEGKKKGEC